MQKTNLNLIPGSVRPVINVSQYDEGRQFQLAVFDGATAYSLTGKTVTIRGTKADGHGISYGATDLVNGTPAVAVSNNVVTITTPLQMTAVAGECLTELQIVDASDNSVHTLNFILMVEQAALGEQTDISDTEIPAIIDAAEANADRAEAAVQHYPYIDSTTHHWMVWDAVNEEWDDTGISAAGANNYADLSNKPSINSVTLSGNKTAADLSLATNATMTGAGSSTAGAKGLVPAPAAGDNTKFLRGDGTWQAGSVTTSLANLTDTDINSPTNNQPLLYNSIAGKWLNGGVVQVENGGTGNSAGYIRTGIKSGTTAGTKSTIEGSENTVSGDIAHAEGFRNTASEHSAHAEGRGNTASGINSHAEGNTNTASGAHSHAEGAMCTASGSDSHAEGYHTEAANAYSHAEGYYTVANFQYQHVQGLHNNNKSTTLFEIGNGSSLNNKKNLMEVHTDGRVVMNEEDGLVSGSNIGAVEMTRTMSASHAKGSFVYVVADDQTYEITSALNATDSLDPGTNATARNIGEVLSSINSHLTDLIDIHTVSLGSTTVTAGSTGNVSADASRTGYTPIGIVGYTGSGISYFSIYEMRIYQGSAYFGIRNLRNESSTLTSLTAYVLYKKNLS